MNGQFDPLCLGKGLGRWGTNVKLPVCTPWSEGSTRGRPSMNRRRGRWRQDVREHDLKLGYIILGCLSVILRHRELLVYVMLANGFDIILRFEYLAQVYTIYVCGWAGLCMNISVWEKHIISCTGVVTSYRVGKGYTLYVRTCNCQIRLCVYMYVFVPLTRYGWHHLGLG